MAGLEKRGSVQRGRAGRSGFEAAVQPHVLIGGQQHLFFHHAVHLGRRARFIIQREVRQRRLHDQLIALSIWQAARQAKMQFYRELDDYSNRIVVRTLQVADQAREALREADAHTAASCSPEHLLTLRRIAYTHRYIQEVLWLRDSVPQC